MKDCFSIGWYTYDAHENYPIFKTHTPCPSTSKILPPLDLGRPISNKPHFPNDNQSIKRKHNPRMTITCYQVLAFRSAFVFSINPLVWISFDFFSFSWSLCFFVALYLCVQLSKNITKWLLFIIIHIFSIHFAINLFYLHNLKT